MTTTVSDMAPPRTTSRSGFPDPTSATSNGWGCSDLSLDGPRPLQDVDMVVLEKAGTEDVGGRPDVFCLQNELTRVWGRNREIA